MKSYPLFVWCDTIRPRGPQPTQGIATSGAATRMPTPALSARSHGRSMISIFSDPHRWLPTLVLPPDLGCYVAARRRLPDPLRPAVELGPRWLSDSVLSTSVCPLAWYLLPPCIVCLSGCGIPGIMAVHPVQSGGLFHILRVPPQGDFKRQPVTNAGDFFA